jgi:hypothetical protein
VLFRRFDGPAVRGRERGQVALEKFAQVGDLAARSARPRRGRHVGVAIVEPAEQGQFLGQGETRVEPGARAADQPAGRPRAVQPGGVELQARTGRALATALLCQHYLVRHGRQVDLVRFLVQVPGRGEILRAEEVADVRRLAVRMALPRALRRVRRDRERVLGAPVGQVLVTVAVAVARRRRDRREPEVAVEELIEEFLVAAVLDQRHPQRAPQGLPVVQGAGLRRGAHGVMRLGHRHAYPG